MLNAISEKFSGMQNDLICLNDLLRQNNGSTFISEVLKKVKHILIPSCAKAEIQSIADKILSLLKNAEQKEPSLKLADAFVRCYGNTWNGKDISQIFDRAVSAYRPEKQFLHNENQKKFDKWQRYGQDALIYHNHPEFSTFMENSGLLSQLKVTRDVFKEIGGEPAIKVNGEWMEWSDFKGLFKSVYSERYRETFVVSYDNQVYTYLDNGKGLQLHHPYLTEKNPTSLLSQTDFAKVLATAHLFVREGEESLSQEERKKLNASRTFVLQLVTSRANGANTRLHDLILNPKHPYLRFIIGEDEPNLNFSKGEVYEVGFGRKYSIPVPLITTEGRFRSPDIHEYLHFEEKIVTNFAITKQEALAFADFVAEYHSSEVNVGNPIGFHYLNQNCSTFARVALESANIKVPTKITLAQLLPKITPLWALKAGQATQSLASKVFNVLSNPLEYLPNCLKSPIQKTAQKISEKIHNLLEALTALVFIPLKIALGEAFGTEGRAFVKNGDKPKNIGPSLKSFKKWFMLSSYSINLPGVLQRWQNKQASTMTYKKPIKLCIVP